MSYRSGYKSLRTTDGLPFDFGMISGMLFLIAYILLFYVFQHNISSLNLLGFPSDTAYSFLAASISLVLSYLIYPGIFLILLQRGKSQARRGTSFGVFWIIVSASYIIFCIHAISGKKAAAAVLMAESALFSGAAILILILLLSGSVSLIISCISFLKDF